MPQELTIAACGAVLLMVHIGLAGQLRTKQYGTTWNTGARDDAMPPLNPVAGRAVRAQANFQETFPIAVVALLGVVLARRTDLWTAAGGWLWLGARVVYLPLYLSGMPIIRSLVFLISLIGLALVLWPLLFG
jgi:uncharacterized MAPEG superfamily protein